MRNHRLGLGPRLPSALVTCKCPKCGTQHEMRLQWVGKAIPRKYCSPCRRILETIDPDYLNGFNVIQARNRSGRPSSGEM